MKDYITDNISIQGYSHIIANKECQDSSCSWKTKRYAAVIVCDGHGGDKYIRSAIGSAIACEVGKNTINEFMESLHREHFRLNEKNYDGLLSRLELSVIQRWNDEISENYSKNPLSDDKRWDTLSDSDKKALERSPVKAYGTTFIAAVLAHKYCFILKLGDGNANLILKDKTVFSPNEITDDNLQFNITTSMCSSDADIMFRHYFCDITNSTDNPVSGIILSSDGVINSYRTEEAYNSLIGNIYSAYGEDGEVKAKTELRDVLNILSEKGSVDDLSIAIIRQPISKQERLALRAKIKNEEDMNTAEQVGAAEEIDQSAANQDVLTQEANCALSEPTTENNCSDSVTDSFSPPTDAPSEESDGLQKRQE